MFDFEAAAFRGDEIKRASPARIQFHQGGEINRFVCCEIPGRYGFVDFDRIQDFFCLPGLAAGEIGGFETAGVVFAFCFAAFVSGFSMRRPGSLFQDDEAFAEAGNDLFYQSGFFDGFW